ncbi:MAG: FAD-dependent oxidoreductase [Anaerolineales bacterium]|nr:MAG: FAD-dependent oxidoreductase [Anaerolineales bacterium]
MKKKYDVVIVGGGVQGLSLAYNLARYGLHRVAVLEKSYIGSGASGRNGEMIRSAFASEEWIRLFDKSLRIWETLSGELDFNVMFTRHGYLILASTSEEMAACQNNIKRQNELGIGTRLVDAEEVINLIPALNTQVVTGGIFQSDGGFARHDAVVWAYAGAARRLKVDICPFTEVIDIVVKSGKVLGVKTTQGDIETRTVVNAAGAYARRVAGMVGVELPLEIYRLEMMVTEPLKPFLRVALSSPHMMGYMHQTTRGEFAGGAEPENFSPYTGLKSTLVAAQDMARKFVFLFPGLYGARLMRQWAGVVSKTPDRGPLLGAVEEVEGFILSVGWGGYGFMGSPAGGKLMAQLIINGEAPAEIRPFSPKRFKTGELITESTIIGLAEINVQ